MTPPFRRVLILTQYYPPETGAAPIRLRAVAHELRRLGIDVRVLTGFPNYPTGKIADGYSGKLTMADEVDGIPVRRVWLYPAGGANTRARLMNYLSFTATAAIAMVFQPRADLVFVEAQPVTLAIPALFNQIVRRVPYVYNTPDLQIEYAQEDSRVGSSWMIQGARRLEALLMRRALSVCTVTRGFIEHFHRERHVPLERLTFLPNGVDTDRLRPLPRDETLAAQLNVAGRKVFIFAGTYAHYQGLEVILEAAKLLKHRPDIVFLMVGDGPVRPKLIEQARAESIDNVIFHPAVPLTDIPRFMSISWAAVLVLRKLQMTRTMRLAKALPPLACGVPLIYAGWGETGDIVEREQVGLRLEPEDTPALARAVQQLADAPQLRDEMGRRGRALAEREFTWSFIIEDWLRQMNGVLERR